MKIKASSIWNRIGWATLALLAIALLIFTYAAHSDNAYRQNELFRVKKSLKATKHKIEEFENIKDEFRSLLDENTSLCKKIKSLNQVARTVDQFIVPDPDQIISHSKDHMSIEIEIVYVGYIPAGNHLIDIAIYESDTDIDVDENRAQYSVQFELAGPTKFEIKCKPPTEPPHKSLDFILELPQKSVVKKNSIEFEKSFSVGGNGQYINNREGIPTFPNELGMQDEQIRFKHGVSAGNLVHTFQCNYTDSQTGNLAIVSTIHSDSPYCLKTSQLIENPFRVERILRMQAQTVDQILDLFSMDPKSPSRMLIADGLNKGLHRRPMRGEFLAK